MEITTKERYFYMTTLPLVVLGLLFLVVKYAPWKNPHEICESKDTKIISRPLTDDYSKSTFKVAEPIKLSLESKYKIESCFWSFGNIEAEISTGSKERKNTTISYNNVGETIIEARLNGVCNTRGFPITIINNCEDGFQNYGETGIDCGGPICEKDCEIVKEKRKINPLPKDKFRIDVESNILNCDVEYEFTCINKSQNNRIEPDVIWIFDQVDTPISGNSTYMTFSSMEKFVDHRIAAFKNGRLLASKKITVRCDI